MKYEVYLYYHGCFSDVVEANSEAEARNKVMAEASEMSAEDFISFKGADICLEDCDVYEAK